MRLSDIEIIHEDANFLALNKPSGLLSIPDRWDKDIPNLYSILKKSNPEIFVVHRLDRDTSGIMLFAKNEDWHRELNQLFQERTIKRTYHVVLEGSVYDDNIDIDIPIAEDPTKKGKMKPSAKGKESLTRLKVLERYRNSTLAEIDLVSGRHHQIRVHCAAIGHPLLIDPLYGNNIDFYVSSVKRKYNLKKGKTEKPLLERITMHASSLEFKLPFENDSILLSSDYPKDFKALIQILQKYG